MSTATAKAERTQNPYFVVAVLCGVYALNFLDRQLLSILAEPVKADLGLTDTQLGLLSGLTFALFYSVFGIPVAWIADRTNRVRLVSGACALWSIFTASCGLAANFTQLALARVGVGIGEAGGSPPSYAIIADYFPPEKRGGAMALYSLGVPIGTTVGAALGGWIAANWGWRAAFISIGIAGVCYSLFVALSVTEPVRGRFDSDKGSPQPLSATLRMFVTDRLLLMVAVAAGLSAFVGYAMLSWTPALLMRTKSMALQDLAIYYSLTSGGAAMIGTLLSGYLTDRFASRDRRMFGFIPAAAFLLPIPFYIAGIHASSWGLALLLMSVPFAFYAAYLPPTLALLQNRVAPTQRSTASSMLLLIMSLIGLGGGPFFIGAISDAVGSLESAMYYLTPVFGLAGLLHLAVGLRLSREAAAEANG
jgi:predicted MFS family arabinose efflux permease